MKQCQDCGFTIVEIISVLVIVGILSILALPDFFNIQERIRLKMVDNAIMDLNRREHMFWSTHFGSSGDHDDTAIFNSVNPENLGAKFFWSMGPHESDISTIAFGPVIVDVRRIPSTAVNSGYWTRVTSDYYDFTTNAHSPDDFIKVGTGWQKTDKGLVVSGGSGGVGGSNRIYIANGFSDGNYAVSTTAQLDPGTTGGYGVFLMQRWMRLGWCHPDISFSLTGGMEMESWSSGPGVIIPREIPFIASMTGVLFRIKMSTRTGGPVRKTFGWK